MCIDYLSELLPDLDCHMELLLVWCQVVALSKKHFPKGSLSQLPLQYNVVSLDVLDNLNAEKDLFLVGIQVYGKCLLSFLGFLVRNISLMHVKLV